MGVNSPLFLTWAYLSPGDLDEIANMKSKTTVRERLSECLGIDKDEGFPTEILRDFHYQNYNFCNSSGLGPEKTAAFISIMKMVQEESITRRLGVQEAFDELFKPWVLKHGVQRPPFSIGVFTFEDIRLLTEYATGTFFKHYGLYQYAYSSHRELDLQVMPSGCSPAMPPHSDMSIDNEVENPEDVPELAFVFQEEKEKKTREMCDAMLEELERDQRLGERGQEVKNVLERKLGDMMKRFDAKLQVQDEKFQTLVDEAKAG